MAALIWIRLPKKNGWILRPDYRETPRKEREWAVNHSGYVIVISDTKHKGFKASLAFEDKDRNDGRVVSIAASIRN